MVKYLLILLIAGCSTTQPAIIYRTAQIPEPPTINKPELPVLGISKEMDAGKIIQLHRETIKLLQAWGLELEAALEVYRTKK